MKKILIVDDSMTIRKAITKFLLKIGFPLNGIQEASDGILALKLIEDNEFDLILSDINMPNMNGIDFVSRVRNLNIKTPIIIVSSEGEQELLFSAITAGTSGYIKKSVCLHLLDQLASITGDK